MTPRTIGSIVGLRPEWVDRYEILHQHTFPGVLDRIARSNIRNYSIFLAPDECWEEAEEPSRSRILFACMDYVGSDYEADMAAIGTDETTRQWWKLTDPTQVPLTQRQPDTWWAVLPEWWSLAPKDGAACTRIAFSFRRAGSLCDEQRSRVTRHVQIFEGATRILRLFVADRHVFAYVEVIDSLDHNALAASIGEGLGASGWTALRQVFHTDRRPPARVFVSGCFDLLHSGHVAFLQEAASYGNVCVGIGSDATIHALKGRYTVNSQDERRYMLEALACVTQCRVNTGHGILDFEADIRGDRPDLLVTNEDGHSPAKEALCRELGIEYRVLRRVPHAGLPARSTTALRSESTIPYRIDLAGGWLDQPYVSRFHPGPVLTISIEPTVEFNDRSGMASSTRHKAVQLWQTAIPHGDPQTLARILFSFENPPGTAEVAGSQDALGIVLPGLNRLDYDGGYWPVHIDSIEDEAVLSWLEERLNLVTLGPRTNDYRVIDDTRIDAAKAKALADAADDCWNAILARDARGFGDAFRRSFEAQVAMFPKMVDDGIRGVIELHRQLALGWKLSGAGGGGYLILVSEEPLPNAIRVRVRRKGD